MKVLIFSPQFEKGALELLDKELATNLSELGVDVVTLNMYCKEYQKYSDNKYLNNQSPIKRHYLNLTVNPKIIDLFWGFYKLKKLIHKEKIEIIQTSSEALSILTSLACIFTKTTHVIGIHKTYNRKMGFKNNRRELIFLILSKLHNKTFFYSVSEWSKKAWINFSKTREEKIKVILNSINFPNKIENLELTKEKFFKEFSIPSKGKIIICVGRICAQKRQNFILKSIGPILKKNNLYLLFIGDLEINNFYSQNDQTLDKIKYLIKKYDIESHVKLTGYRNDVSNIMAISDILVHSTLTEAFGLVLVEAMAMGLTIISSKVEAIPELVKEPDNFLIKYDDHTAFRKAVEIAINRNEKLKKEISLRNMRYGNNKKFTSLERAKIMYDYFNVILKKK